MRIDNLVFKKNLFRIVVVSMLLLLAGCQNENKNAAVLDDALNSETITETEEPKYISKTSKEDCLLCGEGKGTFLSLYWGEKNIGVISLNSFELAHIEINRYNDYGQLIEEPEKGISIRRTSTGEGGFTFMTTEDTNRGYARCDLCFHNDEFLDVKQVAIHMCTDCMNRVIIDDWGELTGMAVIDFSTGELKILRENLLAFQFGDFFISCKVKRDEADQNDLEMGLLVFYCPERYGD